MAYSVQTEFQDRYRHSVRTNWKRRRRLRPLPRELPHHRRSVRPGRELGNQLFDLALGTVRGSLQERVAVLWGEVRRQLGLRSGEDGRLRAWSGASGAPARRVPPRSEDRPRPPRGAGAPYSRRTSRVRLRGRRAFARPPLRCGRRGRTRRAGTVESARPGGGGGRRPRPIRAGAGVPYIQYRPCLFDLPGGRVATESRSIGFRRPMS